MNRKFLNVGGDDYPTTVTITAEYPYQWFYITTNATNTFAILYLMDYNDIIVCDIFGSHFFTYNKISNVQFSITFSNYVRASIISPTNYTYSIA